mgnify:CR=1 FL=1
MIARPTMAKNDYSISAFFPAYNDAGTISSMVITVLLTLRELTDDYEVIVVNDGSQDHTAAILDELARVYPDEVRIIHHPQNRGYGSAIGWVGTFVMLAVVGILFWAFRSRD